jgi:uncharacterized protein YqfB (UPF0267 family)
MGKKYAWNESWRHERYEQMETVREELKYEKTFRVEIQRYFLTINVIGVSPINCESVPL